MHEQRVQFNLFLIVFIVIASFFAFIFSARAEPSPGIKKLIVTPASVFDIFLFKLYIEANGPSYIQNNADMPLFIFDLEYDYDSNLILMSFHIGANHEDMSNFPKGNFEEKKKILLRAAKSVATTVGVEPHNVNIGSHNELIRLGMIQNISLRNGWGSKDFDEYQLKEEIANRTVIDVVYAREDDVLYKVRRTQLGKYEFSKINKSDLN